MNIWNGNFPKENLIMDGFHGTCPVKYYLPNEYGLYNMVGNVWEWVLGGTDDKRILRGGSFVDSKDGSFNHIVMVSTRQTNAGDSGASNIGFRCASSVDAAGMAVVADEASANGVTPVEKRVKSNTKKATKTTTTKTTKQDSKTKTQAEKQTKQKKERSQSSSSSSSSSSTTKPKQRHSNKNDDKDNDKDDKDAIRVEL